MKHVLLTVPTGPKVGLSTVSTGLVRALDRQGVRVGFYKPISQPVSGGEDDRSTLFIRTQTSVKAPDPIPIEEAREWIGQEKTELLLENIVHSFHEVAQNADAIVIEGLLQSDEFPIGAMLNKRVAQSLSAEVVLVSKLRKETFETLNHRIEIGALDYANRTAGVIVNKADLPSTYPNAGATALANLGTTILEECPVFKERDVELIGVVPFSKVLKAPRTCDVAELIQAHTIFEGEMQTRRVKEISLCARTVPNMLHTLKTGNLLVTPGDRSDIIVAASLAAINGAEIAGLILTGDCEPDPNVIELCRRAWQTGLPVMRVETSSFETAKALQEMNPEIPVDDYARVNLAMELVARSINSDWIRGHLSSAVKARLSPAAFRHMIAKKAGQKPKRIVLPEGNEPRTIQAAIACDQRKIAQCVLIGKKEEIAYHANALDLELPETIEVIDPEVAKDSYVDHLVEMRRHKNMTEEMAREHLEDNVVLGTVMLALDEVDGLVSGAEHSSANTVRPALQLIKTHPSAKIVSSVFFMCLPDQVLVYGDCAINPDPNAEELADIAIQSARSARAFGIDPIVAMISYSTLGSGAGADVDKVEEAVQLVKSQHPDMLIDGPLQYDAAAIADVAAKKAPNSLVAGKANVFIFPDLNTGNTTYKAVQRSANLVSIGPMLQGLRKPVNDLSRGALVDDIIYTIALTAIQAEQAKADA